MISYSEADYIVREIGNIARYKAWVRAYDDELREIRTQIDNLTAPVSPNGKESIGEAKGNGGHDWTIDLFVLSAKQDRIAEERKMFQDRLTRAEDYQKMMLANEDEREFIEEYFAVRNKQTLEEKYHISNAYDRIRRIARNTVRRK